MIFYNGNFKNYCNTKLIGTVYATLTGLPLCLPGFHFGKLLITLSASLSREGSTFLTILASDIPPSLSTTKET